jgi:hypothetical protein
VETLIVYVVIAAKGYYDREYSVRTVAAFMTESHANAFRDECERDCRRLHELKNHRFSADPNRDPRSVYGLLSDYCKGEAAIDSELIESDERPDYIVISVAVRS